jgi:hypothetical protein
MQRVAQEQRILNANLAIMLMGSRGSLPIRVSGAESLRLTATERYLIIGNRIRSNGWWCPRV